MEKVVVMALVSLNLLGAFVAVMVAVQFGWQASVVIAFSAAMLASGYGLYQLGVTND